MNLKMKSTTLALVLVLIGLAQSAETKLNSGPIDAAKIKDIKAYCIDFNWEKPYGRPKLARPGVLKELMCQPPGVARP